MPRIRDYSIVTKNLMIILRTLENTPSTDQKKVIIKTYVEQIPEFKALLLYALDPYTRFGIARFPAVPGDPSGTNTWHDINAFLQDALRRDITPTNLNRYLVEVASKMNGNTRELFKRVLLKDLRCGVGATLVNSVFPGLIPSFSCQLATLLEPKHVVKLQAYPGNVYGQPKLNGDRAVTICPEAAVTPEMLTRKGFPLNNYQTIMEALRRVQLVSHAEGLVFDGEVIVGDFFKTRSTKKLAGNEAEGAILHVFDVVEYNQWRAGKSDIFSIRRKMLKQIANLPAWESIGVLSLVPTWLIDKSTITQASLDALRDKLIAAKYEGLIIRLDEGYDFSSSARSCMYKHKSMDNLDCTILEVLPGEAGKKMADVAARLLVELPNGQTCEAGMGKGLNMEALAKLWRLRGKYVGLTAEIAYQDKTVNQSGEWKLQFPKFTGVIRKDKS